MLTNFVRGVFFVVPTGGLAFAHSGTHSYVFVRVRDSQIGGNVQFPINDLNAILDMTIPQHGDGNDLAPHLDRVRHYASDHLSVEHAGIAWTIDFDGLRFFEDPRGSYVILEYSVTDTPDPLPAEATITYDGIIEAMPEREALVIVETDSRWERYRKSLDRSIRYRTGSTSHVVGLAEISWRTGASAAARDSWRRSKRLAVRTARRFGLHR